MSSTTEPHYWEQRYQEGTSRWDLGQPAPPFVHFLNSPAAPSPGRTAVLGCGRGYDALLFADHRFEVIGFDFAPSAIADAKSLAQASGRTAQFLQRNVFEIATEFDRYFDYVVEHTCFCAILPEQRHDYVQLVHSLLKPQGELIGLFWTHDRPGGPPFGSTSAEIHQLFQTDFELLSWETSTNSVPERQGQEQLGRFRLK